MQLNNILSQFGGLESIARELGISEAEAASGTQALAPSILGSLQSHAQNSSQAEERSLFEKLGGSDLLTNAMAPEPTDLGLGNNILGQIFGSKEVSRNVAEEAAPRAGLSPDLLKKMLPILTMMITGYLAQHGRGGTGQGAGGGIGALLESLIGGSGSLHGATAGNAMQDTTPLNRGSGGFADLLDSVKNTLR
jgi:hypothetical protein